MTIPAGCSGTIKHNQFIRLDNTAGTDYTITGAESMIMSDKTSGSFNLNLPVSTSAPAEGKEIEIITNSASNFIIKPQNDTFTKLYGPGGAIINGIMYPTTYTTASAWSRYKLVYIGSNKWVLYN